MTVAAYMKKRIAKGPFHFTLLDPDPKKLPLQEIASYIKTIENAGSHGILIGGSTGITQSYVDTVIKHIKKRSKLPVVLFPGNLSGVSRYADAIFFMSLFNSSDVFWVSRVQAKGAFFVKKSGIEVLSVAYLVVEPGMAAGNVGKAELIKQTEIKKAAEYALAAEYLGFKYVYFEAGSGATKYVPPRMIRHVKKTINIPVIVGGGIRTPNVAKQIVKAGADIVVTGAIFERDHEQYQKVVDAVIT